jgi:hypothetical protein
MGLHTALPLAAAVLLLAASQGAKADYWVRGEAVLKGSGIPAACGAVGKAFSQRVTVNNKAVCQNHGTCTAVKKQAVTEWTAQFNQRNLGVQCNKFVQQSTDTCTLSPDCT